MKERENTAESWAEILRAAVKKSGQTQYRLATDAQIGETQLARFMQGAGLNLSSAERLGHVLGLELRKRRQAAPKQSGKSQNSAKPTTLDN